MSTPLPEIRVAVEKLRASFEDGVTIPYEWRLQQLRRLQQLLQENVPAFKEALFKDLRRSPYETTVFSISDCLSHLQLYTKSLKQFMKSDWPAIPLKFKSYGTWEVVKEPFGVALVIAPWNFPVQLLLNPLIGAIAAGNTVLLKPSELSANTAQLFAELIPQYLDPRAVTVVLGGVPETTEVLKQRFDFICYTGSTTVGKIVMTAAAKHLTPVLLELGGKNPVYVHKSCDLEVTARRIIWGKTSNCGQICLSPDYVLVDRDIITPLIALMKKEVFQMFGEDPQKSDSYSRIVSESHFDRLLSYLNEEHGGEVIHGGQHDKADKYISPTIVLDPKDSSKLMSEELFGPILILKPIDGGIDEAVKISNAGETPLAAYCFAGDSSIKQQWQQRVYSGGQAINDIVGQLFNLNCPFGGKGASGIGCYRGKHTFDAFTHRKTVCKAYTSTDWTMKDVRYAPFSEWSEQAFSKMMLLDLDNFKVYINILMGLMTVAVAAGAMLYMR